VGLAGWSLGQRRLGQSGVGQHVLVQLQFLHNLFTPTDKQ
jgi:hypothetical protein